MVTMVTVTMVDRVVVAGTVGINEQVVDAYYSVADGCYILSTDPHTHISTVQLNYYIITLGGGCNSSGYGSGDCVNGRCV